MKVADPILPILGETYVEIARASRHQHNSSWVATYNVWNVTLRMLIYALKTHNIDTPHYIGNLRQSCPTVVREIFGYKRRPPFMLRVSPSPKYFVDKFAGKVKSFCNVGSSPVMFDAPQYEIQQLIVSAQFTLCLLVGPEVWRWRLRNYFIWNL